MPRRARGRPSEPPIATPTPTLIPAVGLKPPAEAGVARSTPCRRFQTLAHAHLGPRYPVTMGSARPRGVLEAEVQRIQSDGARQLVYLRFDGEHRPGAPPGAPSTRRSRACSSALRVAAQVEIRDMVVTAHRERERSAQAGTPANASASRVARPCRADAACRPTPPPSSTPTPPAGAGMVDRNSSRRVMTTETGRQNYRTRAAARRLQQGELPPNAPAEQHGHDLHLVVLARPSTSQSPSA